MGKDDPVPDPLARERALRALDDLAADLSVAITAIQLTIAELRQDDECARQALDELSVAISNVQLTIVETREDDTRLRMKAVLKGLQRVLGKMEAK